MKANYFYQVLFALVITSTAFAAENAINKPIVISGTKFTYPLIEKWIAEYSKVNPRLKIQITQKLAAGQTADLNIIAHQPDKEESVAGENKFVYAGKYALLPVTNLNNPILANAKRGLSKKEIDKLFFDVVNFDADPTERKSKYEVAVYSSDSKACASNALADYFGHQTSQIRGNKVLGDDIYLLSAVKKDSIGIAYNNLGYIYDTNSRKLKEGLALLPLDLKKDAREILTGDLDNVIGILENTKIETIPVEYISFVYSSTNPNKEVLDFLKWVLTEGQQYNHEKGFLRLGDQAIVEQTNRLNQRLLTLK